MASGVCVESDFRLFKHRRQFDRPSFQMVYSSFKLKRVFIDSFHFSSLTNNIGRHVVQTTPTKHVYLK